MTTTNVSGLFDYIQNIMKESLLHTKIIIKARLSLGCFAKAILADKAIFVDEF